MVFELFEDEEELGGEWEEGCKRWYCRHFWHSLHFLSLYDQIKSLSRVDSGRRGRLNLLFEHNWR